MKNLFLILSIMCSNCGYSQSVYWYQYGQKDIWFLQPDVYAFRMDGGGEFTGSLDMSIVDSHVYQEGRRDKANEIYFKPGSTLGDRELVIKGIEEGEGFDLMYPVVTKTPTLSHTEENWFIIDDLILVNFRRQMSSEDLDQFMAEYHLDAFHTPSSNLPAGGNYTYVFSIHPDTYMEQDGIAVADLLIELDSGRVLEASPNFANIRTKHGTLSNSVLVQPDSTPPLICNSNDPLLLFSWHIENPGGFFVDYIDANGNAVRSPFSVQGADTRVCKCWSENMSGTGVTVGIMTDGAFDFTHPDVGNYGTGWDCTGPCAPLDRINAPAETDASGTYLASLVGASRNNSEGMAGIAYNSTVNAYRIDEAANTTSWAILIRTLQRAINDDVDVLMLGWMFSPGNSSVSFELLSAVNVGRGGNGIILVATPGGGINVPQNAVGFPASYQEVLSVIGTNPEDQVCTGGDGWDYQNPYEPYNSVYGLQYDLAAPAVSIYGHDITNGFGWETAGIGYPGNDYATPPTLEQPFAAPTVVAGIAALLLQNHPNVGWQDIQQFLKLGADQVGGYTYSSSTGKSIELGHGRVNCYQSLLMVDAVEARENNLKLNVVNPLEKELRIFSEANHNRQLRLELVDLSGKHILNQEVLLPTGEFSVALPNLKSGMYILYVSDDLGRTFSKKLVKF